MTPSFKMYKHVFLNDMTLFLIICFLYTSCSAENKPKKDKVIEKKKTAKVFSVSEPKSNSVFKQKELITLALKSNNILPDSVQVRHKSSALNIKRTEASTYKLKLDIELVGLQTLDIKVFYNNGSIERHSLNTFLLPNEPPSTYSYTVVKTLKHDPNAYTQGLLYEGGFLYESTGRRSQSALRRLNTETGELVKNKPIEHDYFGEGIAVVGDEIYMLTYVSQVGFVFDAETFDIIRKFNLQTKEGWGLTTYNNELVLSDGSANLYFFNPKYFTLNRQIEVCDINGLVSKLNELEYTPMGLFANVYGEDYIVLIDIETGIVKGKLDLSELYPKDIPRNYDYVLNGIAYNYDKKTFYVTGKQWPVIYEISLGSD